MKMATGPIITGRCDDKVTSSDSITAFCMSLATGLRC